MEETFGAVGYSLCQACDSKFRSIKQALVILIKVSRKFATNPHYVPGSKNIFFSQSNTGNNFHFQDPGVFLKGEIVQKA